MHRILTKVLLSLTTLMLVACATTAAPTPPGSATPQPTEPNAPPTATPTPEIIDLTPTHTAAPTSLNPTGPYILFAGPDGIWIANPDGSIPTRISDQGLQPGSGDLRRAVSPTGDRLALIVQTAQGLDLVVVTIPGAQAQTITRLLDVTEDQILRDATSPLALTVYAIRDYPNVAWQPGGGRLLAFMGAINGPTSDLYVLDTQTGDITQLTAGPSHAVLPSWSPDGQYILHAGVKWTPPFGGAIGGADELDGVWSVRIADGEVITLPTPASHGLPNIVGWLDDSHYLTYDSDAECGALNLRSVDVTSGDTAPIMDAGFSYYIAQSPDGGLLFASGAGCPESLGDGVFLLPPGQSTPVQVIEKRAWAIRWMPESSVFFAYPEALLSSDGATRYDPPVYDASFEPAVSMQGYQAWEVIENRQGRVVVKVPGADWQTVIEGFVRTLIWDPVDGNTLLIPLEDGSLYAATYPDFTPRLVGNLEGMVDQAMWLP